MSYVIGMMLARLPRVAWLVARLPAVAVAVCVFACREEKSVPSEPQPAAPAEPSTTGPGEPATSAPERTHSATSIPRAELLALLLEPKLSSSTPDDARKRFARVGLERVDSLPESFNLTAKTDDGLVNVGYFRQDGRWTFTHLRYHVPVATAEEAKAMYAEIAARVRDKLGEPQKVVAKPPYFAQAFKLGSELDATVGAVAGFDEGRPYAALAIAMSQP